MSDSSRFFSFNTRRHPTQLRVHVPTSVLKLLLYATSSYSALVRSAHNPRYTVYEYMDAETSRHRTSVPPFHHALAAPSHSRNQGSGGSRSTLIGASDSSRQASSIDVAAPSRKGHFVEVVCSIQFRQLNGRVGMIKYTRYLA